MAETMKPNSEQLDLNKVLNSTLSVLFKDIVKAAVTNPSQSMFFFENDAVAEKSR